MNIQQINNSLAITDFLANQGFQPAYKKRNDWWYISPIRPAERTPSFKVNTTLNRWYDHGSGEGGKVFDLALRLYRNETIPETIQRISEQFFFSQATPVKERKLPGKPTAPAVPASPVAPSPKIEIQEVQALSKGSQLSAYLLNRGIRHSTAQPYCSEVSFSIGEKEYQALGFPNSSGGYELRNAWFKGSSAPKDITYVDHGAASVCLLEGFMDFLSLLELRPHLQPKSNFIILNSVALAGKSLELLGQHRQVFLFLDRDAAGRRLTEKLLHANVEGIDASSFYRNHQDVNEYLVARKQRMKRSRQKHRLG
ncbi:toprim domain-containing protein [Botryobacter ruber]|uniref:toprim domain-containing protein n=1 Tax=Botryobacter ruber TaxID=2171629 RepID=UPI000E0A5C59|nr:toprim domain-containing protein [Botryobacter ruber]